MSVNPTPATPENEDGVAGVFRANAAVDGWRFDEFVRLGLDLERAERAALTRRTAGDGGTPGGYLVDVHVFAQIVGRGATPEQAFRILF